MTRNCPVWYPWIFLFYFTYLLSKALMQNPASRYALNFSVELYSKLLSQFFCSIYLTNETKIKLTTQSTILNSWWVYPNPPFCLFSSLTLLVYLPYSIYLSNTEPKWNTLPKNPNHYYFLWEKFKELFHFFSFFSDNQ